MIDEKTAREVAARYLGSDEFELREFDHGWRIARPHLAGRTRGGGAMVVERATGKLLLFASGIPPRVIHQNFAEIRPRAVELVTDDTSGHADH